VTAVAAVFCGLLGLLIGSFLNVVVWRVPQGRSIVSPASHCPRCDAPVRPRDNPPVVSWLLLRGRCRDCRARISIRYPLVELGTAVVFAVLALRFGVSAALPAFLYLGAVGVALALIDVDTHRLPDVLTLPSYAVGTILLTVAAIAGDGGGPLVRALLGMLAAFAFFFVLAFSYPAGMGFGDVKLAGVLGLYLAWVGWSAWFVGVFAGFVLGGVVGLALIATKRAGRKSAVPFGPFMLLGALVGILLGPALVSGYLSYTVG